MGFLSTAGTVALLLYVLGRLFKKQLLQFKQSCLYRFMSLYNVTAKVHKERLFGELSKIQSKDPKLQKEGKLRILEIGCGSGANLEHLPKGSHLVMLDPNESFRPLLEKNLCAHPSLKMERFVLGKVEKMSGVADNSVDAVVCTLVLCSVDNVAAGLAEVRRVLAPGGKFIFLEHVAAERGSALRVLQWLLSASGLWPSIFCGCVLNKDLDKHVANAGFSSWTTKRVDIFNPKMFLFHFIRSQQVGVATK